MSKPANVTIVNVGSASWRLLRDRGATHVYPGHGPSRLMIAE